MGEVNWLEEVRTILRSEQSLGDTKCPRCFKPTLSYNKKQAKLKCQSCGFEQAMVVG